jgi:hypothetical protein
MGELGTAQIAEDGRSMFNVFRALASIPPFN